MLGLMMQWPLLIASLIRHADQNHGDTEIVSRTVEGPIHRYTYRDAHTRARKLANALTRLGVAPGECVGTLAWNGSPVDRPTMQGYISQEATKSPQPEVHITVDRFSKYEVVAQTLADLQHRGLKKIGFVNNDFF